MPNDHEHAVCGEGDAEQRLALDAISLHYENDMDHDAFRHALNKAYCAGRAALTAEVERVRAETIEACAKVADQAAKVRRAESGMCRDAEFVGAFLEAQSIATAIRALAGGEV